MPAEAQEDREIYRKAIADAMAQQAVSVSPPPSPLPQIAPGIPVPDPGLMPRPGTQPTPTIQAPPQQTFGPPRPDTLASLADNPGASQQAASDERAGLNVAAYNAQRRAYDRATGAPVASPPTAGAQVFAKPSPQAGGFATGFGPPGAGGVPAMGQPAKDYLAALGPEEQAIRDKGAAEANLEGGEADAAKARADAARQNQADIARDMAVQEKQYNEGLGELKKAREAVPGVDPDRFWHSKSTGEQILLRVASIVGGFFSGFAGRPNEALAQINKRINDDIRAQEKDIETAHGRVNEASSGLARMIEHFGDVNKAKMALRAQQFEGLAADAEEFAATARSGVQRANAEVLATHFHAEAKKDAMQLAPKTGRAGPTEAQIFDGMKAFPGMTRQQVVAALVGAGPGFTPKPPKDAAQDMNVPAPTPMTFGERVQASLAGGLGGVPVVGPALKNTPGYRKELEQEAANIPVYGNIHKNVGIRQHEDQRRVGAPLLYENSDDAAQRAFKSELRQRMGQGGGPAADPLPSDVEDEDK